MLSRAFNNRGKDFMLNKLLLFIRQVFSRELPMRRWWRLVIFTTLFAVGGAALLVFIVDPHYRYRLPRFYDTVYYQLYATAPRLLKDFQYDTLYIGSSMNRNFYLSDINKTLNVKALKLAAAGAATIDLKKLADIACKEKKGTLKEIIFSLDIYSLNKSRPNYKEFEYLYRDDFKEEYRYLFSRQTYSDIYYLLKRKMRPKKKRQHQNDPDKMFSTQYPGMRFGMSEIMADAIQNEASHHTQTPANPPVFEKNLADELLALVSQNPELSFRFYLAPYHIYTYCQSEQFGEADALLRQRTRVMKELLKFPNVRLYDYQADRSLVCTPEFYSDVQHFSVEAGRLLLKKLAADERQIRTPQEVESNEKELRALIREQMPLYYENLKKYKKQR
jgi:hypothetical protein